MPANTASSFFDTWIDEAEFEHLFNSFERIMGREMRLASPVFFADYYEQE